MKEVNEQDKLKDIFESVAVSPADVGTYLNDTHTNSVESIVNVLEGANKSIRNIANKTADIMTPGEAFKDAREFMHSVNDKTSEIGIGFGELVKDTVKTADGFIGQGIQGGVLDASALEKDAKNENVFDKLQGIQKEGVKKTEEIAEKGLLESGEELIDNVQNGFSNVVNNKEGSIYGILNSFLEGYNGQNR